MVVIIFSVHCVSSIAEGSERSARSARDDYLSVMEHYSLSRLLCTTLFPQGAIIVCGGGGVV